MATRISARSGPVGHWLMLLELYLINVQGQREFIFNIDPSRLLSPLFSIHSRSCPEFMLAIFNFVIWIVTAELINKRHHVHFYSAPLEFIVQRRATDRDGVWTSQEPPELENSEFHLTCRPQSVGFDRQHVHHARISSQRLTLLWINLSSFDRSSFLGMSTSVRADHTRENHVHTESREATIMLEPNLKSSITSRKRKKRANISEETRYFLSAFSRLFFVFSSVHFLSLALPISSYF